MARRTVFALLIIVLLWPGGWSRASGANTFVFQTNMFGTGVVPPVKTDAWGFVRFFFNDARTEADYTVDVKGVSSSIVTGADMFRGAPGTNGILVRHLADGGFLTFGGHMKLTPAELADFVNGAFYVELYTVEHPEGEMRGQVYIPSGFLPGTTPDGKDPTFAGIPAPVAPQPLPAPPPPASGESAQPNEPAPPNQGAVAPPPTVAQAPPAATGGGRGIQPPNTGDAGLLPSGSGSARAAMVGLAAVIIGVGLIFASGSPGRG